MRGRNRNIFYFILLAGFLAIIWAGYKSFNNIAAPTDKSTYDLIQAADAGKIQDATIKGSGTEVDWSDTSGNHYKTTFRDTYQIETKLLEDKVHFNTEQPSSSNLLLSVILPNVILFLVIGGFMWYMLRQSQSGNNQAISFGRSRARLLSGDKPAVTFNDVAGVEEAKQELTEVVEFLKFPEKFTALGARIPKGVLMVGPPGTGKTLLSKAVAGEAGVPFFSISGSEFVEMFVGVGASRVRDLFDQAKKNSPCIVFVDEIDAVGRQRGAGLGGGHDEREQTLNQLLVEMDGFETNTHVIVIAATNRPDVLDPALLRPGRFDRQVVVPNPDIVGREKILKVHMRKVPLASDVDPRTIARGTPGFSGADLANLVNEAALMAARKGKRSVSMSEFELAKDKVLMGAERRSMVMSDDEKKNTAYHEGGHALVMLYTEGHEPLHKVTIIPRGRALGVTMFLPEQDKYSHSKYELEARIAGLFGGRVAEELIFGTERVTTGASDDIRRATSLARRMVTEFGFSDKLGPLRYSENEEEVFLGHSVTQRKNMSDATAKLIDEEIRRVVEDGERKARQILSEHMEELHALAKGLLEFETLSVDEIKRVIRGEKIVRDTGGPAEDPPRQAPRPRSSVPPTGKPAGGFEPEPQPGG